MICRRNHKTDLDRILEELRQVKQLLETIIVKEKIIMADLAQITASVAGVETAEASAVALLKELSDLIRANATDPAALTDLANRLDVSAADLAAAVVANTPAV